MSCGAVRVLWWAAMVVQEERVGAVMPGAGPSQAMRQLKRRASKKATLRKEGRHAERERDEQRHRDLLEAARKVPLDVLAGEWLEAEDASVELRAYLAEKLFPVLVAGLEKTLRQSDRLGLVAAGTCEGQEAHPPFNPVVHLAQYLMRHHPSATPATQGDGYARSMTVVQEELRARAHGLSERHQAEVQAEARRRRHTLEAQSHAPDPTS